MDRLAFNGVEHWAAENSPESLAFAISKFSTLAMRAMGISAAGIAHRQYSWATAFEGLFDIYERVLSG
jgi:hypothetical protein